MITSRRSFSAFFVTVVAGTAIATGALAQSAPPGQPKEVRIKGSLDKPIGARAGASSDDQTVQVTISSSDGSGSYSVTIKDDEVSAEANGTPVPPERIERKGNVVIIKGEDGKALKTFDVGMVGGTRGPRYLVRGLGGFDVAPPGGMVYQGDLADGQDLFALGQPAEPPPVMVGVTMSDPDSTLLEHLGIEAGEAFMIDRVIEGLPAAEAGLKPYDVVVKIEGKKPATQERFREVLREKKAGDTLELAVVRKGKEQTLTLKLVAYDASRFGEGGGPGAEAPGVRRPFMFNWSGGDQGVSAEARKAIEEALKSLRDNPDLQPDTIKKKSTEALEQALQALKESRETLAQRYYNLRSGRGGRQDVIVGDQPGQLFAVPRQPAPPAVPGPDMTRHLERVTDMLERLEKRLDEMEKRLEKSGR